ncbi:hypothetical protein KGF56_002535 [Candida oxycetoniae]|uniref:Uncharacterized protein n=1 Tax=Candida oxycetoniae TaxID=497107 RepID=A0AAI9SWY5_9ASCO|nr:uncharacterized protein KGF56_002535 [Candida oxycetoniae]KAI3404639.2 hypothetical protein KGF56_002535 [Candida oxycetoniae]
MSVATNRVAFSTIRDTQLNSSTPLVDRKSKLHYQSADNSSRLISLTPRKYRKTGVPDLISRSFSIEKSGTYYDKSISSTLKSKSFASHHHTPVSSPENSSTLHLKSSLSTFKNDVAGLAATKLKLKLQFALHKVKQNKIKGEISKVNTNKMKVSKPTSNLYFSRNQKQQTPIVSPHNDLPLRASAFAFLPTPPEQVPARHNFYTNSINVNLQTKNKAAFSSASLSKVASNKTGKKYQKLRLFQIKKTSVYYSGSQRRLPLTNEKQQQQEQQQAAPAIDSTSNLLLFCQPTVTDDTHKKKEGISTAFPNILPSLNLRSRSAESSFANQTPNLPSINKILKTPLKRANMSRSFRFQQSFNNAAPTVIASRTPTLADETTIDEDNDMTLLQNTTCQNSTIDQIDENTTIRNKDDGIKDDEDEQENESDGYKKSVLDSSPITNHLGTPNSRSVAKSLLQLGGHRM